ncbi:hypothetical protein CcaverHIS002_0107160 [Cutaneotrichosporon cavernicola]|nr:hypothetical protein CcaverHIS002_0107160 [Cutaneotrichosporon cavernicola]BEI95770.1 hypothetical protein CcaverHIS631_0107190 [Cutaneotrichosporon cavernicola]BEJ03542.1 hypothetical protein CcaverHIS641_0107170 [Cutaneotrichosporon cavernicola]
MEEKERLFHEKRGREEGNDLLGHNTESGTVRRAGSATTLTPAQEEQIDEQATSSPRVPPARLATVPYSTDYDMAELDLGHAEHEHGTYSSLPPSPRGTKFDYEYSHRLQLDLDVDVVLARLDPGGSPRVSRRRLSLDSASVSAHDSERELEEVEQFWPARSRRQTLDSSQVLPPISPTSDTHSVEPEPHEPEVPNAERDRKGLSIWDLLRDEDAAEQWEGWIADGKWERIANFLAVPVAVEKVITFGSLLCLDSFLYNFTILPIRATFAFTRILSRIVRRQPLTPIPPAHVQSVLRLLLIVIPAAALLVSTDASKMYHSVRGQDTIKLYVIFNALEIGDRLCCAFGQDVLDTLFARDTLDSLTYIDQRKGKRRKRERVRPAFFFFLSLGYVLIHTIIFFYMLIALNVAINSYDYTLISLLISNQFVEIKGSVFKKFEKENLFQIMCADIVERFQLGMMLLVIAMRNMMEMAGSDLAFLPKSFTRGSSLLERILSPVLFVLASEMVVDWMKHAFIAKFNHVRASVYGRFTDVLAKDVLLAGTIGSSSGKRKRKHPILLDQSPLVARRLGIANIPLAVLVIRISAQIVGMLTSTSTQAINGQSVSSDWIWLSLKWALAILITASIWGCLVALKILLGLGLLSYSALRQAGMDEREAQDTVNDFGRGPVGISKEEIEYNKQTSRYLSKPDDDLPDHPSAPILRSTPQTTKLAEAEGANAEGRVKGKKKAWRLEEVERWTMVKRIW